MAALALALTEPSRERLAVRFVTGLVTLAVTTGLCLVAIPHASAAPPIWTVNVRTVNSTMPGSGQGAGFTVACPAGQTPIAGSYSAWGSSNVQRAWEEVGWGSGASYGVWLKSGPNNVTGDITVRAYCVDTGYFSGSQLKSGTFTASSAGVVSGTVGCDPGWFSLSARITFNSLDDSKLRVRTSTPDMEFDAWYAVGSAPSGTLMFLTVRCVPAWNMSNVRFASHSVAIGSNGADAWATCPTGMVPLVGGTWQDSGSGAVTTQPQPYLPTRSFVSDTYGGTGTMRTNVVCIPSQPPTVTVSNGTPAPSPNSSAATWSFSATDPAASGGYTLSTQCSLNSGSFAPCVSPVQHGGLADGTHTLDVRATTSDGRVSTVQRGTVRIDTTAPTFEFLDPAIQQTNMSSTRVRVTDADPFVGFRCALDGGEEALCGGVSVFGSATTTISWPGPMADGLHVLRVKATDGRGNATIAERAFTVDTVAPTVTQQTPAQHFTVSTSVTVSWAGSDATSGVASYDVRWQRATATAVAFDDWTTVTSPGTASSRTFGNLVRGATYCYSVRAVDHAGHASPWTRARCTAVPLDDRDLARSSGWRALTPTGWFRGTALVSTTKGATLSVTGVTLKRVALVAQKCPTCGVVGIYVRGTRVGTIDLAARTGARRTFVLPAFSQRTGTVTLRVLSSSKRVQIDALGVSRR